MPTQLGKKWLSSLLASTTEESGRLSITICGEVDGEEMRWSVHYAAGKKLVPHR